MNKRFLHCHVLLMSLTLFLACTDKVSDIVTQAKYPVCFRLKRGFEILPFPSTKSIPEYKPAEPNAFNELEDADLFTRVEYVVYHKETGALIKHKPLTPENSDDFGEYIYDELEAGTYIISLLAHKASAITLSGNDLTQADVSDSFYASTEITVGTSGESNTSELLLERTVSRIEFVSTKRIPEHASRFIIDIAEQYKTIDLKTGEITTHRPLRKEYLLAPDTEADNGPAYLFYTFVPEPLEGDTSYLSNIKLTTLDINEDTIHTISLSNIPILKNRVTRYNGSLYTLNTHSSTLELKIEDSGHWKDTIQVSI